MRLLITREPKLNGNAFMFAGIHHQRRVRKLCDEHRPFHSIVRPDGDGQAAQRQAKEKTRIERNTRCADL